MWLRWLHRLPTVKHRGLLRLPLVWTRATPSSTLLKVRGYTTQQAPATQTPFAPAPSEISTDPFEVSEHPQVYGKKLWKALRNNDFIIKDGVLTLNGDVRWLHEPKSQLFLRSCQEGLFQRVMTLRAEKEGVLITGNPGIGKSWFLMYALYRLAQLRLDSPVVYWIEGLGRGWVMQGDRVTYFNAHTLSVAKAKFQRLLGTRKTILLYEPATSVMQPPPYEAFIVMVSSPNTTRYNDFVKRVGERLLMPCWKQNEIIAIAKQFPKCTTEDVLKGLDLFGGMLRPIFISNREYAIGLLEAALQKVDMVKLIAEAASPEGVEASSHKLFYYDVSDDYVNYHIEFASPYVEKRIHQKVAAWDMNDCIEGVIKLQNNPRAASLRGLLFEPLVHELMLSSMKLSIKRIDGKQDVAVDSTSQHLAVQRDARTMVHCFIRNFEEVLPIIQQNQNATYYIQPSTSTFELVDAFYVHDNYVWGIQSTVARVHRNLVGYAEQYAKVFIKAGYTFQLVFAVPSEKYLNFPAQKFYEEPNSTRAIIKVPPLVETIPQWAVDISMSACRILRRQETDLARVSAKSAALGKSHATGNLLYGEDKLLADKSKQLPEQVGDESKQVCNENK